VKSEAQARLQLFRKLVHLASIAVLATGLVVLAGWLFDLPTVKSLLPSLSEMKANTALGFVLAGAALWLRLLAQRRRVLAWLPPILAAAVALLGIITLSEYVFSRDLGIDQMLFNDPGAAHTASPGRMAPHTAFGFALLGTALLLLGFRQRRCDQIAEYLCFAVHLVSLAALIGYAYSVASFYRLASFAGMSLHTAAAFFVLTLGVLFAHPERGAVSILASPTPGGMVARRLIGAVILVPLVLGWLRLEGQHLGLFSTEFGTALLVTATILIFAALLFLTAKWLDANDVERLRVEEEIRALNAELEQRVAIRTAEFAATNKELEAFSYSVSHDLRAPLRHIDGFSKILVEDFGEISGEARGYLERIRESVRHMGRLLDDLLNLARLGRHELRRQVTGLDALVDEVVKELKPDVAGRQVEFRVGSLPFVDCDPALLKQVFHNLLSNAVKYTRPRKQAVVEIGQMAANGEPIIFVRDNGVGFSMKYADKLFGVFQRLHRSEDFEGTGVGLATVQRIVQKHGGRVWAEAELDKGATFYMVLGNSEAKKQSVGGEG
jgi:signal transduction histidine kinase